MIFYILATFFGGLLSRFFAQMAYDPVMAYLRQPQSGWWMLWSILFLLCMVATGVLLCVFAWRFLP